MMSSTLREKLKKVLTPAVLRTVRVADGSTPTVVGTCTARVAISGHPTSAQFLVLEQCPYDVILGIDFLSTHSALVDCGPGVLQLELPPTPEILPAKNTQLCSSEHVRLPLQSTTYVLLTPSPAVAGGDYVASPITDVVLAHNVTLPHTVVEIANNEAYLPVLNFYHLPSGIALATLASLNDCQISSLTFHATLSPTCSAGSTSLPTSDFNKMIAADLSPAQADELSRVLASYRDVFDFDNRPLRQTMVVMHRIDTDDANPIHRRPYHVSAAERAIIYTEVDKMAVRWLQKT